MSGKLHFPLSLDYVRAAPLRELCSSLQEYLRYENPPCLLHPHGFYVVLLGRSEGEEWRFHLWPQLKLDITGMPAFIHTHDSHVDSRLLHGQLTNTVYEADTVTVGGYPLYQVGYNGDRYAPATSNFLQHTGTRVQPKLQYSRTFQSGDCYHVERHCFHEVRVLQHQVTSTLVCMHGRSAGAVRVIGLDGYPDAIAFTRVMRHARDFVECFTK